MTSPADIRAFYTAPAPMTALPARGALPDSMEDIFAIAAGVLLHRFWANAYGETLTPEREGQAQTRSAAEIVAGIKAIDGAPITQRRPPSGRFIGVCRHFTVLTTALLRAQGIPARSRCGFATYFDRARYVDHWVVEYWDGARWKLGDSQLDELQRNAIKPNFDPLDVPRDQFLVAGDAWRACRAGAADPARFGILDMWGLWFIAGNVVRDLAALNNAEMLPWDVWGLMPQPGEPISAAALTRLDEAAALTIEPDATFEAMRALYAGDGFRMPGTVINYQTGRAEAA